MKISIASYAFHGLLSEGKMDVFGYLESLRHRYQLFAADIWNGMFPTLEDSFIRKVREAMDEKELTLVNLCVDDAHIWENDPAERDRLHKNALANLRAAAMLGAKTVRIDMGGRDPELSNEQFDHIVTRYREYCQFANDHGFRIGPENHWGAERRLATLKKVYPAVDHPAFGHLLHIGGWDGPGTADDNERAIAPWVMHTHVSAETVAKRLEPAMGILLDAGYQGYWGVEHHSAKNEYAEVEWQIAEVRRALARRKAKSGGPVETGNPMIDEGRG